jgi:hypothetical protein
MHKGSHAADLRRLGQARAQDRHRNAGQVEVERNPCVHEEGACKELAHPRQGRLETVERQSTNIIRGSAPDPEVFKALRHLNDSPSGREGHGCFRWAPPATKP